MFFPPPLLRGGADAPTKQMPRYLKVGAAGEVKFGSFHGQAQDLPNEPAPIRSQPQGTAKNPTPAEELLWKRLRRKQLLGKKFRRQFSVGHYIVDFYCVECNLAIELDGARHFEPERQEYESQRTAYLESMGVRIVRFENAELFQDIDLVLEVIREAVRETGV